MYVAHRSCSSPFFNSLLVTGIGKPTQLSQQGALFPSLRLRLGSIAPSPIGTVPLALRSASFAAVQPAHGLPSHCRRSTGQLGAPASSAAAGCGPSERQGRFPVRLIGSVAGFHFGPLRLPGLPAPLDGTRNDCLAPGTHGHLLVNHLDDLLPAASPSLDSQHRIGRRAHKLDS